MRINKYVLLGALMLGLILPAMAQQTGIALYSFHRFTFEQALQKTDSTGCRYVQGFAWQAIEEGEQARKLDGLSLAGLKEQRQLLDKYHLKMPSLFVGDARDIKGWQRNFEMSRVLGGSVITCEPGSQYFIKPMAFLYKKQEGFCFFR